MNAIVTEDQTLEVGTRQFGPVRQQILCLRPAAPQGPRRLARYRTAIGKGQESNPMDNTHSKTRAFDDERRSLMTVLQHTGNVSPTAGQLLAEIVARPHPQATNLPQPTSADRKPPDA